MQIKCLYINYVACVIKSILSMKYSLKFHCWSFDGLPFSAHHVDSFIDDPNNGKCNYFGHVGCYDIQCTCTYTNYNPNNYSFNFLIDLQRSRINILIK